MSLWGRAGGFAGHFGAPTFERHLNRKPGPGAQGLEKPEARRDRVEDGGAHGGRRHLGFTGVAGRACSGWRGGRSGGGRTPRSRRWQNRPGTLARRFAGWAEQVRSRRGRGGLENPRPACEIKPKRGHQIDDQKTGRPTARKGNLCVQGSGGHFLGLDLMTSLSAGSCHMRVGFSFSCLVGFWKPGRAEAVGRSWLSS